MKSTKGFTLIEVIAVLLIMSIILVVTFSSSGDIIEKRVDYDCEKIKACFNYARLKSMNSDLSYGVRISGTKFYILRFPSPSSKGEKINIPGEQGDEMDLSQNGVSSITNCFIIFDSWGSPYDKTNLKKISDLDIKINNEKTITISKETGWIS